MPQIYAPWDLLKQFHADAEEEQLKRLEEDRKRLEAVPQTPDYTAPPSPPVAPVAAPQSPRFELPEVPSLQSILQGTGIAGLGSEGLGSEEPSGILRDSRQTLPQAGGVPSVDDILRGAGLGQFAAQPAPPAAPQVAVAQPHTEEPATASDQLSNKWKTSFDFGATYTGDYRTGTPHRGIDIVPQQGGVGTSVEAFAPGTVSLIQRDAGAGGLMVYVQDDQGLTHAYMHLAGAAPGLAVGQRVNRGTPIALMGESGTEGSPHLHYEVRKNAASGDPLDQLVDPRPYMATGTGGGAPTGGGVISRLSGAVAPTTAAISGGGPNSNSAGDRAQQILGSAASTASWLGEEGQKALQAVLITEGGLNNARGDGGASAGPLQFFEGGQLANFARAASLTLEQAKSYVEAHPFEAIQWAIGSATQPGYLGIAIAQGIAQGMTGATLATYAQEKGQVSVSPERAGQNWNALFGSGQPLLGGAVNAGNLTGTQVGGAAVNAYDEMLKRGAGLISSGQTLADQQQKQLDAYEQQERERVKALNAQTDKRLDELNQQTANLYQQGVQSDAQKQQAASQASMQPFTLPQTATASEAERPLWERVQAAVGDALKPILEQFTTPTPATPIGTPTAPPAPAQPGAAVAELQPPKTGNPILDFAGRALTDAAQGHLPQGVSDFGEKIQSPTPEPGQMPGHGRREHRVLGARHRRQDRHRLHVDDRQLCRRHRCYRAATRQGICRQRRYRRRAAHSGSAPAQAHGRRGRGCRAGTGVRRSASRAKPVAGRDYARGD